MKRIYFLVPTVEIAKTIVDELLLARIEERHIHILAKHGTPLEDLPEASLLQKSDFIPAMERGLAVGGTVGTLAGLIAVALGPVSLVVAILMAIGGYLWLAWMLRRAKARGEHYDDRAGDPTARTTDLPSPVLAAIPLLVVLGIAFWLHDSYQTSALIVALLGGCLAAGGLMLRTLHAPGKALSDAGVGALIAIGNTAAVVGFGAVAKLSPAFADAVQWVTHLPGGGLVGAAVAVSLIAAMTGSASGGQSIALPILAPIFLAQGVNPDQLHRVIAISSGCLDSLPHNGYVVTTIRAICGETHQGAYPALAALTVIVPLVGLLVAIGLFALGM